MSWSPFRPLFVALEIIRIRKSLTLSMLSVDKNENGSEWNIQRLDTR